MNAENTSELMSRLDLNGPVELAPGVFWVGQREGTLLERNVYLRVYDAGSGKRVSMLVDPGPPTDLTTINDKVSRVVGNLRNINLIFANHQDPDVCFNAAYLQKLNPNLFVICSEDTWRLIHFYGLDPKNYRAIERFKNMATRFPSGQTISFIPTPFCHFRGAMMLYDLESRILFTGDLFGGLSYDPSLFATDSQWEGLKTFHQIYMPSQDALRLAVRNIRELDPQPLILAPQHGSIITGEWIPFYLDKLEELSVGLDLILDSKNKDNYIAAMNELLLELSSLLGPSTIADAVRIFREDGSFPNVLHADASGVRDIKVDLPTAIELFARALNDRNPEQRDLVQMLTVKVLLSRNIPLPETLVGGGAESPQFLES